MGRITGTENSKAVSAAQVATAPKADEKKGFFASIFSSEKIEETSQELKFNTVENIYKQIEELCVEYRMSMEDVKKSKLLEGILGCNSPEELLNHSPAEIQKAIEALEFVLTYQSWEFIWNDRDIEDITLIREQANKKYISNVTGRTTLENVFRKRGDVEERLQKADLISNEQKLENLKDEEIEARVQALFDEVTAEAIASGDKRKIQRAYLKAFKMFGDILNDTQDPRQKELLTAAIQNLGARDRANAAKISVASCGIDQVGRSQVARGINNHYDGIVTTVDALGYSVGEMDAISISATSFGAMIGEDYANAVESLKSCSAETAKTRLSGALIGGTRNTSLSSSERATLVERVLNVAENLGIHDEVITATAQYLANNPTSLNANSTKEVKEILKNSNYISYVSGSTKQSQNKRNNTPVEKTQIQAMPDEAQKKQDQINEDEPEESSEKMALGSTPRTNTTVATAELVSNPSDDFVFNPFSKQAEDREDTKTVEVDVVKAIANGKKEYEEYRAQNGIKKTVLEVFNNIRHIRDKWVVEDSLRIFKTFSNSEQIDTLKHANNSALCELLPETKESALLSLDGETFTNYYATQQVDNAIEDIKEKENAC